MFVQDYLQKTTKTKDISGCRLTYRDAILNIFWYAKHSLNLKQRCNSKTLNTPIFVQTVLHAYICTAVNSFTGQLRRNVISIPYHMAGLTLTAITGLENGNQDYWAFILHSMTYTDDNYIQFEGKMGGNGQFSIINVEKNDMKKKEC